MWRTWWTVHFMLAASVSLLCHSHAFMLKTQMQEEWVWNGSLALAETPNTLTWVGALPFILWFACACPCAPSFAHQSIPPPPPAGPYVPLPLLHLTCDRHIINLPTFSRSLFYPRKMLSDPKNQLSITLQSIFLEILKTNIQSTNFFRKQFW